MKFEESFGVVPLRKQESIWEVFLIQHHRGHYWGFPKGHAEEGETNLESALRELKEETNLDFVELIEKGPFVENYQFMAKGERISKRVSYFAALVSGSVALQSLEIQDGRWVPFPECIEQITHPEGKAILQQVEALLKEMG